MPKKTAVPSAWRISAPAPVASASGTTPKMKAKDVIKIGRRRVRAASTAASHRFAPRSSACLANSTIRIAFLAANPISTTNPIWVRTLLSMPRNLRPFESEPGRQVRGDDPFHCGDRLAGGETRQRRALYLGGREQVVARHAVGAGDFAEARNRAERNHVVGDRASPQILDVSEREPKRIVGLCSDPIGSP